VRHRIEHQQANNRRTGRVSPRCRYTGAGTGASTEAICSDRKAYRTTLGRQRCGCRRPHLEHRASRQNDNGRPRLLSAERPVGCPHSGSPRRANKRTFCFLTADHGGCARRPIPEWDDRATSLAVDPLDLDLAQCGRIILCVPERTGLLNVLLARSAISGALVRGRRRRVGCLESR
jgi:hypothetical protein